MPLPAHTATSSASRKPLFSLGRIVRLALIGLVILPFVLASELGLVASTTSVTAVATADAQIRSAFPNRNYGSAIRLRTRALAGDNQRTLLRFTVPNLTGKVQSVRLKLFVRDRSNRGGVVRRISGSWSEGSVTWNKAPALDSAVVGRIGSTGAAGSWVSVPLLLGNVKSGQKVELAIVGASTNGAWYASRETGKGPRLVLAIASTSGSNSNPNPNPTPDPGSGGGGGSGGSGGASSGPTVGILIGSAEIARLPTSGTAWTNLKSWADGAAGTPDIQNQDEDNDIHVLAKGLVYARTGIASYRAGVLANLKAAVGSEAGGRTLALGRNLPGYVIAADLIDLSSYDAAFDTNVFRPWLRRLLTENLSGDTLRSTHETRPNNWGTHAGAARAALARYLGDTAELARTAQVFHGWLGDRGSYAGFKYGDVSWQCDAHEAGRDQPEGLRQERPRPRRRAARRHAPGRKLPVAAGLDRLPLGGDAGCHPPGAHPRPGRLRRVRLERPGDPSSGQLPVRPGVVAAERRRHLAAVGAEQGLQHDLVGQLTGARGQEHGLHRLALSPLTPRPSRVRARDRGP